jgi:hypothetical protein
MADTSVFSRLRRLFGTDVVIRNVGGNQLKVADTNQIQSTGKYQTNSLLDRFSRLYQYNNRNSFNPNLNYQTLRVQIYSDYEAMDTDPIIASALDIIAEEASLRNDLGEVLTIKSSDENIQKILYNLFYDVLNIEFNLWSWVRNLAKYGDFYLKLEVAEEFGVYNVIPYTVYHITRHEGEDLENPTKVEFRLNLNGVASSIDPNFTVRSESSSIIPLDNYEIAHFRLLADTTYLPYGRSYLEPARKIYKQLTLMEDAMLIHRIMRSPEKRMFFINVGSIPPAEVEQFMQKTINQIKKEPYIDPKTGQYNLRFNLQNMMEDFYIPVRGGDTSTRIDTTKGLEYDGIKDVEYLRDKMFAALRVPKAYMGYEGDLQGKATLAAEDIRFARTVERIQRVVESELTKIALIHLYVQGYKGESLTNFELKLTTPSTIYEQEKVALLKEKIDLAAQMMTSNLFPSDFIYEHLFNLSEDKYFEFRDLVREDKKRAFRISQIENEGNDPVESGLSYGTPHDLASMYGRRDSKDEKVPVGYSEQPQQGRPVVHKSIVGTPDDPLGGIDRLGKKDMKGGYPSDAEINERRLRAAVSDKKQLIYEQDRVESSNLLDESNILDL